MLPLGENKEDVTTHNKLQSVEALHSWRFLFYFWSNFKIQPANLYCICNWDFFKSFILNHGNNLNWKNGVDPNVL